MTLIEIWKAGKLAEVRKMVDNGYCGICGTKIADTEDEEVGFYGSEEDYEVYEKHYSGYIEKDEELEEVKECSEGVIEAVSYYDFCAATADVELKTWKGDKCVLFCSKECENKF